MTKAFRDSFSEFNCFTSCFNSLNSCLEKSWFELKLDSRIKTSNDKFGYSESFELILKNALKIAIALPLNPAAFEGISRSLYAWHTSLLLLLMISLNSHPFHQFHIKDLYN